MNNTEKKAIVYKSDEYVDLPQTTEAMEKALEQSWDAGYAAPTANNGGLREALGVELQRQMDGTAALKKERFGSGEQEFLSGQMSAYGNIVSWMAHYLLENKALSSTPTAEAVEKENENAE